MSATVINPVELSRVATVDPADVAMDATNGNVVANTGKTILRVSNADVSNPHTLTVNYPSGFGPDASAISGEATAIPASGVRWFSDFDPTVFGSELSLTTSSTQLKITAFEP